jgi:two-component system, OmpR family, sensor kinase
MTHGDDYRPAVARLRRTRRLLAAVFTAITAACLIALGTVTAQIDYRSNQRVLDDHVRGTVTALSRDAYFDDNGHLNTDALHDDDLAHDTTPVIVVAKDAAGQWQEQFTHLRRAMPRIDKIRELAAATIDGDEPQLTTVNDIHGAPIRVATATIGNGDGPNAVIMAAADPVPGEDAHRRLVLAITLACGTLVALAAVAGYLLAGRSMRPALQMLDDQEQFLADAAHELRTPLANLRLVTEAGLRPGTDTTQALRDARDLTDRIARLVTGLLARTRTQSGMTPLERVPLRLDQLVESIISESGSATVINTSTTPTIVSADPDLLGLAVRNLIDNSVLHGHASDAAPVEVTVADGTVTIRDHGPGIDPTIGDPFRRGITSPTGGHGIGLSIVRWIATAHSGSATLTPAPGGGTIATLTLPPLPPA